MIVDVIIPALNEERSLPLVLREITDPRVRRVVVVDNGSTDGTAAVASEHGAAVVQESRRGYGSACLAGLRYIASEPPDVVAFVDADYSDFPHELGALLDALCDQDLVIGSRTTGTAESGALLPQARFGNWLATRLIRARWGVHFTDLGPFRVVRWPALEMLRMRDPDFGWTVEMQVRAASIGLRCAEVPVSYRKRVGVSKITGTLRGSWLAGKKILYVLAREALVPRGTGVPS
jgi:glycosyltransferase involved in cell wall biosynthesis